MSLAHNPDDIENVLQACLEALQSGQETIDSLLARYPELADQLRPELEIALWLQSHAEGMGPRPEFVTASRQRLMGELRRDQARERTNGHARDGRADPREVSGAPAQDRQTLRHPAVQPFLGWFTRRLHLPRTVAALALACVLLLALFFSGSGIVLAAESALPGDPLYPVKTTYEQAALRVSNNELTDAQLSVRFTQRRLMELNRLIAAGRYDNIDTSVAQLAEQVNTTLTKLDAAAEKNAGQTEELAASLETILSYQNQVIASLIPVAPDPSRASLVKAMVVSQNGADAAQDIQQGLPPRLPPGSPEETDQPPSAEATLALLPTATPNAEPAPSDPSPTPEPTASPSPSPTPTRRWLPLPLFTATLQPTPANPQSPSPTWTAQPSATAGPTETPEPTGLPLFPSDTPSPWATVTAYPSATAGGRIRTPLPTATPEPSAPPPSPTLRPSNTPEPSATPQPSATPRPTATPTSRPTATDTPTPTQTPTATVTNTPEPPPRPRPTSTPVATPPDQPE